MFFNLNTAENQDAFISLSRETKKRLENVKRAKQQQPLTGGGGGAADGADGSVAGGEGCDGGDGWG